MHSILKRSAVILSFASIYFMALAGCSSEKTTQYTPDEKAKFNAPLGQPMPPEAKAAMEKMGKGGPPPGGAAPAPPAVAAPAAPAPQ